MSGSNGFQPVARVEAIKLPWAVCASVSNFKLSIIENENCELLLDTFWGQHIEEGAQYRRVLIQFNKIAAVHYNAIRHDGDPRGKELLDWSSVFVRPKTEAELEESLASHASTWKATGYTPNSHVYQIIGSKWISEYFGLPKHFLISGGDAFVEVLAIDFEWKVLGIINI